MEEITLKQKIDTIFEKMSNEPIQEIKKRKIKIPRKAKVRKGKLKKGWIGILKIDENGNFSGEKQKLEGSTIMTKGGTYHATDGREVLFWEGKFPVIIQPTWRTNPLKVKKEEKEKNETYGQKYIRARMLGDVIKVKTKGGSIIIWLAIGAVVIYVISKFFGGA